MNPQVFREYDIRGIVEDDFDDDFVVNLGRAYATMLNRAGKATITLGRDCRLSSDRLFGLLIDGLLPSGINVVDIGVVPTPLLLFFGASLADGRRRDDHRQPQCGRVQRLQARRRTFDDLRRGDPGSSGGSSSARIFRPPAARGTLSTRAVHCRLPRLSSSARSRCGRAQGRGRRRQRLRRRGGGAADARDGARDGRTFHRDGRPLSQPSSGPHRRGEHARPHRRGEKQRRAASGLPTTATPIGSARSTRTAVSSGATS